MLIKTFKQFSESNIPIGSQYSGGSSGGTTAPVGPMGPNYGSVKLRNNTISTNDTEVIYSELDSKLYSYDDYQSLYFEYLKNGGKPLSGFNQENLDIVVSFIKN